MLIFSPTPYLAGTDSHEVIINENDDKDLIKIKFEPYFRFSSINQELSLMFTFSLTNGVNYLEKKDLKVHVEVFGKDEDFTKSSSSSSSKPKLLSSSTHQRELICPSSNKSCSSIVIFRERTLRKHFYSATIELYGIRDLFSKGLLTPHIEMEYLSIQGSYTVFETILRGFMFILSFCMFHFFFFMILVKQYWTFSKTEQKWICFVLLFLMFFNNPFYGFTWIHIVDVFQSFIKIMDIFFLSTFGNFVLLFFMVITHSFLTHPKDRSILFFYLPKCVSVGINWIFITILLIWERFNQVLDVGYSIEENSFYEILRIMIICSSVFNLFLIVYYVFRGLTEKEISDSISSFQTSSLTTTTTTINSSSSSTINTIPRRRRRNRLHHVVMSENYQKRFKVFLAFSMCVVGITAIDVLSLLFTYFDNAVQFLTLFPLYNFYGFALMILFLPSGQLETDSREKLARFSFLKSNDKEKENENEEEEEEIELVDDVDDDDERHNEVEENIIKEIDSSSPLAFEDSTFRPEEVLAEEKGTRNNNNNNLSEGDDFDEEEGMKSSLLSSKEKENNQDMFSLM